MNHSIQTSTPIANTPDSRKSSSKTSGSKTPTKKFHILNEFASNPDSQVRFSKERGLPHVTFVDSNPSHSDFGYRLDKSTRSKETRIKSDSENQLTSVNLKNLLQAIMATYESNRMDFNQIKDKTFKMVNGGLQEATPPAVTKRNKEHGGVDLFESLAIKSPDSPLVDTSSNNSNKLALLASNKDTVIQIDDGSVSFENSDLTYSSAGEIDEMLSKLEEGTIEHSFLTSIKAKLNDSGSYIFHENELVEHIGTPTISDQPVNRNLEDQFKYLGADSRHQVTHVKIDPEVLNWLGFLSDQQYISPNHQLDLSFLQTMFSELTHGLKHNQYGPHEYNDSQKLHQLKQIEIARGLFQTNMASRTSKEHGLDLKPMKNDMDNDDQSNQFNQLFASYRQRQMMYHLILPTVFIVGVSLGFAGIIPAASLFIGLMATSGLAFMAYTLAQSQLVQFDNDMLKKFSPDQALESLSYTRIAMNAVVLAAMLYGITLLANPIVCLAVFTAVITAAPLVYTQHVSKSSQQALRLSMFENDGDQNISSTSSATPKQ